MFSMASLTSESSSKGFEPCTHEKSFNTGSETLTRRVKVAAKVPQFTLWEVILVKGPLTTTGWYQVDRDQLTILIT